MRRKFEKRKGKKGGGLWIKASVYYNKNKLSVDLKMSISCYIILYVILY